jgi:hypothetical protein
MSQRQQNEKQPQYKRTTHIKSCFWNCTNEKHSRKKMLSAEA